MTDKKRKYEENFRVLESITESLNRDEVGIDDLVDKTKEALGAARECMEILQNQKGEFRKLEAEFSSLLSDNTESDKDPGTDDPF